MTKRRVWRYKCDFCKKANCSSAAVTKHEQACTNNPNRICGMCASVDRKSVSLEAMIAIMASATSADVEIKLSRLKQLSGCPACTLAALRQSGVFSGVLGEPFAIRFDYPEEAKAFWQMHDDDAMRRATYRG